MKTLGDIAEIITGPFGSQLHQSDYRNEGVPLVMPQNISDRTIDYSNIAYISSEDAQRLARYETIESDILYARRGDVEKHAFISADDCGAICGTGCLRVRVCSDEVDPLFLSFYLNREEAKCWLVSHAVGTNMPNLNTGILSDVPINYPKLNIQRKIAMLLNEIEKKVKNNNNINDNLAAMVKTIYDYWFIQFDFPDENGKPYCSSGGKMAWNDTVKKQIPEKWIVQSVLCNQISEIIKPGVDMFDSKLYLATADVKGSTISAGTIIKYESRESRANMQPRINTIWFAKMKNSIKHLFLNKEMLPLITDSILSTGFCGLQCDEIGFEYMASYISSSYFEIHKDILAHGATQEAVNNDDLAKLHIVVPNDNILQAFHLIAQPIYAQISKNICENRELIKLRDWLLPMLMNGQATIED